MDTLTSQEFSQLHEQGEVIEADAHGLKVLSLPNDRILKIFRRKRSFSSQMWAPHAARFIKNAKTLKARNIETIQIESHLNIPEAERQAVVYKAVLGDTLRDYLQLASYDEAMRIIKAFGQFIAELHAKGIIFRSVHLGNIIVTDDDSFALIDIVDMGFNTHRPLDTFQRMRNFTHLARYSEDCALLTHGSEQSFLAAYFDAAGLSSVSERAIHWTYRRRFALQDT